MARRMALFCGIPTTLGISSFFIFYWLSSNQWLILPPYIVLFVSFSLFGLGFVGLSYGIFSTSWDETQAGSWLGSEQVKLNWQRTTDAWKASRKNPREINNSYHVGVWQCQTYTVINLIISPRELNYDYSHEGRFSRCRSKACQ